MREDRNIFMRIMPLVFVALLILAFSCEGNKEKRNQAMAHQLFDKSVTVIRTFTDSVAVAKDSATFNRLVDDFDEQMAKVNYQFPPDTDLSMTLHENDSIMKLMDIYVATVRKKQKEIDKMLAVQDTVSTHGSTTIQ